MSTIAAEEAPKQMDEQDVKSNKTEDTVKPEDQAAEGNKENLEVKAVDSDDEAKSASSASVAAIEAKLGDSDSELSEEEAEVETEPAEVTASDIETAKGLMTFLKEQNDADTVVEIFASGSRKKKMSLSKTVIYQLDVKIKGEEFTVWRVYEEFVLLRASLIKRLEGSTVPPLPHGFKAMAKVTDAILAKRLNGLQRFMEACSRHPFIRNDSAFLLFINSPDSITKKVLENLKSDAGIGVSRWKEMVNEAKNIPKPIQELKATQEEVAAMLLFYANLQKEVVALSSKLASYAGTAEHFNSAFEEWKNLERKDLKLLKGVVGGAKKDQELSAVISEMQVANQSDKERILRLSEQILAIMKPSIKYEVLVLDSLQKDFEKVKEQLSKHKRALKARRSVEADVVKSGGDMTFTKVVAAQENELARKEEAEFYCRATLVVEMSRYRYERAGRAGEIYRQIALLKAEIAKQEMAEWTRVSALLPVSAPCTSSEVYTLMHKSRSNRHLDIYA